MAGMGYSYKKLDDSQEELELQDTLNKKDLSTPGVDQAGEIQPPSPSVPQRPSSTTLRFPLIMACLFLALSIVGVAAGIFEKRATSNPSTTTTNVPQYLQTTPEIYAGLINGSISTTSYG